MRVIFLIFILQFNCLFATPKWLSITISYWLENTLFEEKNISFENFHNEHFKIKITQTDSTFTIKLIPHVPITLQKFHVMIQTSEYQKFFSNGFQSWTLTQWYFVNDKVKKVGFPFGKIVKPYGDYAFWYHIAHNKKNPRSHFFTILEKNRGKWDFYASLNDDYAYTIFEKINNQSIAIHKDVEGLELIKPFEILQLYFQTNIELHQIQSYIVNLFQKNVAPPVIGWTSWYNYYTNINENIVLENLDGFYYNRLPIDYIQIDDGWQQKVGDWEPNGKFSKNLKDLTEDIHKRKYKAGLWIAPFIVEKNSYVYKHRKDWLVFKPGTNKLLKAGYNPLWSGFFSSAFYVLDIYHPEVQIYLRNTLKRATEKWQFDLLKLDFLYAVALVPRNGKTRAMIMNDAIKLLNAWKGKAKLLGCGVPLASAFGKLDYCRIGPDIGLYWDTRWMKKLKNLERISTMNAIHNTLNRCFLNGLTFGNDPDVSILRTTNNHLKPHQKKTLFYVNHLLGNLNFISDNPIEWTDSILNIYKIIFPHQPLKVTDWKENEKLYAIKLDDYYLLMVNMNHRKFIIEVKDSLLYDGINQRILKKGDEFTLKHGEAALLQKVDCEQDIGFVGSVGYILPGKEVEAIASDFENQSITVSTNPKVKIQKLWLKIPQDWNECKINGKQALITVVNGVKLAWIEN